jgi:hypothetical protein
VRRILLVGCLLAGLAPVARAQDDNAVGVVLFVENSQVSSLDVSFPAVTNMTSIQDDLKSVSRWTGWNMVGRPAETSGNTVSVHAQVTGGEITSILDDAVWPVVGALASHGHLGIVVFGAPVVTAKITIENNFVRLEQSGGQGVQSYQAFIKSTAFRSLDDLRQPGTQSAGAPAQTSGPHSLALAWVLVVIAALASGIAVYLIVNRVRSRSA